MEMDLDKNWKSPQGIDITGKFRCGKNPSNVELTLTSDKIMTPCGKSRTKISFPQYFVEKSKIAKK